MSAFTVIFAVGQMAGPWLAGVLADHTGAGAALGWTAALCGAGAVLAATVDGQGRLTAILYMLPAVGPLPAMPMKVDYSRFGTAADITVPPAAEVGEASREVRGSFADRCRPMQDAWV